MSDEQEEISRMHREATDLAREFHATCLQRGATPAAVTLAGVYLATANIIVACPDPRHAASVAADALVKGVDKLVERRENDEHSPS